MKLFSQIAIVLFISGFASVALGQVAGFSAPKEKIYAGDGFVIDAYIDTGGAKINAISGEITVSGNLEVTNISYGDSILTLWPNPPIIKSGSDVSFVGGVPSGFGGSAGKLVTLEIRAKSAGQAYIKFASIEALLNDGKGSRLPNLDGKVLDFTVLTRPKGAAPKTANILESDTEPPEGVSAQIVSDPSVFGGKYFVSFHAVDKGSGVDHYLVEERPFIIGLAAVFREATTSVTGPIQLSYQIWPSLITVTALDRAGNSKALTLRKPSDWPVIILILIVLLLAVYSAMKLKTGKRQTL